MQILDMIGDSFLAQQQQIQQERERCSAALDQLKGMTASRSSALPTVLPNSSSEVILSPVMRDLLQDCLSFIQLCSTQLGSVGDPNNIRYGSSQALLSKLRGVIGTGRNLNVWTSNDTLLLLQRLIEKETSLQALEEKDALLLRDMMSIEDQRDAARRSQEEAEARLQSQQRELAAAQETAKKNEEEANRWRQVATQAKPAAVENVMVPTAPAAYAPAIAAYSLPTPAYAPNTTIPFYSSYPIPVTTAPLTSYRVPNSSLVTYEAPPP